MHWPWPGLPVGSLVVTTMRLSHDGTAFGGEEEEPFSRASGAGSAGMGLRVRPEAADGGDKVALDRPLKPRSTRGFTANVQRCILDDSYVGGLYAPVRPFSSPVLDPKGAGKEGTGKG